MANPFALVAGRALRSAEGKNESRTQMIKAVRAACRRLGLDDDDRRQIQQDEVGKASMADMTLAELGKLLDRFNRDWKGPSGHGTHLGKIRALWWTLYWIGAVDQPKETAIDAFVRRQTGISALRFVDHRASHSIVDALKAWAAREGVLWEKAPGEFGDRRAVLTAIWAKLRDRAAVNDFTPYPYASAGLSIPMPQQRAWTRHEWDAAIRLVGKRMRREMAKT